MAFVQVVAILRAVPPLRAIRFRPRFNLQFLETGRFTLTQYGEDWTKSFETLVEALQCFRSFNPNDEARLAFYDGKGIEMESPE